MNYRLREPGENGCMPENKLDALEQYYKTIYENLRVALFRCNMDGKIIMANSVLVEMLGHTSLKELNNIEGLDRLDKWEDLKKSLNKEDAIVELTSGWTLENGLRIFTEIKAKSVRNETGEQLYIDGTAEVISNKNIIGIAKRSKDVDYNDLMENDLTAHFISDAVGKLLLCNSNYGRMFGYESKESAVGRNVAELFMSEARMEAFLDIIKKEKKVEKYELELIKVNGQHINVLCNVIGDFDPDGRLIEIKWFLFDVTLKKIIQQEISELTKVYSVLSEINQAILGIQNVQELYNEACIIARDEGGYKAAAIFVYDNVKNIFDLKASLGMDKKYLDEIQYSVQKYNGTHNYISQMIGKYEFLIIDDIKDNYQLKHLLQDKNYNGFNSILFLPLKVEGRITGLFQLYSDKASGFSPAEINLYNVFTNNISFAVENYQRDKLFSQAEYKLSETERKYSTIFENVQDVFYQVNLDGTILEISPSIKYFSEFDRAELIGKPVTNLYFNANDRLTLLEKIYEKGEVKDYEIKLKTRSGHIKYASINARLINDSENKPHHIDGSIRDITERVNAELELRKLKLAIEQSPIDIIITDIDGNIEYVNANFMKQTGYTFEELKGVTSGILKSNEHPNEFYRNIRETITSGNSWQGEIINKKKNNELYWANTLIVPISNNDQKFTHFVYIEEDITEKKKILDELIMAKEKAEEINRIKTNFFAHMSHELRTPFVGILGNAEFLAETLTKKEERELAEGVLSSSKRLMETLNKILEITKIESERIDVNFDSVSINKILLEIDTLYKKTAQQKNLDLIVKPDDENIVIQTDEKLVRDILENLVNNAIKYTSKGSIEIGTGKVFINNRNFLTISVEDTGIGIPSDKQNLIWEEFRQVSEGINRNFEGAGLGLTIVRKYVSIINGKISLESEEGRGTKFTITLPCDVMDPGSLKTISKSINEEERRAGSGYSRNQSLKILYVEDDDTARFVVKKFLNKLYDIDLAENSDIALKRILTKKYDMILMDINLKNGLNGIELTGILRMLPAYQKVPIVAVTAYAHPDNKKEFLSKGLTDYLSKPFLINELNDLAKKLIYKKQ